MNTLPSPMSPMRTSLRELAKARLATMPEIDVLILGGGVNGVATLRELALNGLSCALLETNDFCAGASSASSRMAHGGLRYLEGREFGLVAESARERNRLIAHAGHLVKPLEIVVPLRNLVAGFPGSVARFLGLSNKSGPLSLAALVGALRLYEAYGRKEHPLPAHKMILRKTRFPQGLHPGTRALVTYCDGQITQPEGLMFEMIAESMSQGAKVAALNHVSWQRDGSSFQVHDVFGKEVFRITPKLVVNATGAWIDHVNAQLGGRTSYLRGVKGAHIVLNNPALSTRMDGRAFYFDDGTGRMIITLPVGRNVLVGTTEVDTSEPEDRSISEDEIGYLLRAIDGLFSDIAVTGDQIISMTTGIRPLRRSSGSATSAARDHVIQEDQFADLPVPVLSLVGGKWTTFRAFAESAGDRIFRELGRERSNSTAARQYPGAARCTPQDIIAQTGITQDVADRLVQRYGALARDVAPLCTGEGAAALAGAPDYCRGEMIWAIRARGAMRLEDLALRRSRLTFGHGLQHATLKDLAALLYQETGRSEHDLAQEIQTALRDPRLMGQRALRKELAA
ncbi:glycerol-3-phosphate dehydrogenase/oxidase [Roseinatronobacter alkalisoli]|uniref:Glycerol-3-phosphate dehydrogenase/oxidase n=1 Tax=Roseinatronobacter alkalisoli TaxID=3028235 RepID=A0ABT5THZ6_9RHOB|nr:glycerol-3-phosphate dehydrogenase/oxidase [Roseinatronobacter sp. HJB301]MDD7973548.1 glycerol-3-phosphate dehydrogenase/oxidase [Roseinatronobacter sp. HJB301]